MKTYQVVFTPEALDQLRVIEQYIATSSGYPAVAAHYVDELVTYCEALCIFPQRGAARDDIRRGLRVAPYRHSTEVAFAINADVVWIIGLFYAGQDIGASLHGDLDLPD